MSEILYFIQIFCLFVGKSATFQFFRTTVPLTRTICSPPISTKGSVSAPEPSIHKGAIFLYITSKTTRSSPLRHGQCPEKGTAGGHGSFCGSGVQFCGQLGVHGALLCLIGSHCLISQGGALAVGGQHSAHLADDVLHFLIVRCLHRIQSAASRQCNGDFARLSAETPAAPCILPLPRQCSCSAPSQRAP